MKNLSMYNVGKLSMRQMYAGTKTNQYDVENMPGGGEERSNPPKQQI